VREDGRANGAHLLGEVGAGRPNLPNLVERAGEHVRE
jgi:hypothetical protein